MKLKGECAYVSRFRFFSMRQSPWKTAPGLIESAGVEMLPFTTAPEPTSTRSWPTTSPITMPLMTQTATLISASTFADASTISVPLYLDFGKGMVKLGEAQMVGNTSVELKDIKLSEPAKRAAICALDDVLALNIQNAK